MLIYFRCASGINYGWVATKFTRLDLNPHPKPEKNSEQRMHFSWSWMTCCRLRPTKLFTTLVKTSYPSSNFLINLVQLQEHVRPHRGRHAKFFGWAKSAAYDRRSTSDLRPITHNIGIGDKQKSCVMCVKFSKEWKTILHIVLLKFV